MLAIICAVCYIFYSIHRFCKRMAIKKKKKKKKKKNISCSTQLSMKFSLPINVKIFLYLIAEEVSCSAILCKKEFVIINLRFISRTNFMLSSLEHENGARYSLIWAILMWRIASEIESKSFFF